MDNLQSSKNNLLESLSGKNMDIRVLPAASTTNETSSASSIENQKDEEIFLEFFHEKTPEIDPVDGSLGFLQTIPDMNFR